MKKAKTRYKKPNFFIYGIFYFVSKIISKTKFNLQIKRNEIKNKKGPYGTCLIKTDKLKKDTIKS